MTEEEKKQLNDPYKGQIAHWECFREKQSILDWQEAVSIRSFRRCPNCKSGGRKDEASAHMTCTELKCKKEWCYVCGKSKDEVDKEKGYTSFSGHYFDWKTDSKRCPQFLQQVNSIDKRYPDDAAKSLDEFHEILYQRAIIEWLNKYGIECFDKFAKRIPEFDEHSDLVQKLLKVKLADIPIINRPKPS